MPTGAMHFTFVPLPGSGGGRCPGRAAPGALGPSPTVTVCAVRRVRAGEISAVRRGWNVGSSRGAARQDLACLEHHLRRPGIGYEQRQNGPPLFLVLQSVQAPFYTILHTHSAEPAT